MMRHAPGHAKHGIMFLVKGVVDPVSFIFLQTGLLEIGQRGEEEAFLSILVRLQKQ